MQGEPDERVSNEEKAESRTYRRIVDALERDDIDELAAALRAQSDPAWSEPESHGRQEKRQFVNRIAAQPRISSRRQP